jgi:hypothetical protein
LSELSCHIEQVTVILWQTLELLALASVVTSKATNY